MSYYNRNLSNDFKYTYYSEFRMYEFNNEGNSAEDTIFAYDDLQLKNIKNFQNIRFYLGSDTIILYVELLVLNKMVMKVDVVNLII